MITLTFLLVEEGRTYDVSVPQEELVATIWQNLQEGIVLTDIAQEGVTP